MMQRVPSWLPAEDHGHPVSEDSRDWESVANKSLVTGGLSYKLKCNGIA
jgi:hypothetical protein